MSTKITITSHGEDTGQGNLLGIQPNMYNLDYASLDNFSSKLESCLLLAQKSGLLNSKTIVVFPEYIGTWLVVADLPRFVYRINSLSRMMVILMLFHPINILRELLRRHTLKQAIFLSQSKKMGKYYQTAFSALAKKFEVTIVAGSIVLPDPLVKNDELTVKSGDLFNCSIVFKPDGKPYDSIIQKVYPISSEQDFTKPGNVRSLPVFDTPAGKLGVLICADSWNEDCYQNICNRGAELVVVPSYLSPTGIWEKPWHGDKSISEKEAWISRALPHYLREFKIKYGLNVFLQGDFWGLGSDGQTIAVIEDQINLTKSRTDSITNVWIK